jgi:ACT domain-containing protein
MSEYKKHDAKEFARTNKALVLECLEKQLGIVSNACKQAGIHRDTFYKWRRSDSEFRAKVDALQEVAKDFGETQLIKNMKEGKEASIIFFCKTRLKDRGYSERHNFTKLELPPLINMEDINLALTKVIDNVSDGTISVEDARDLSMLIENKRKALESTELAQRLTFLETKVK